MLEKVTPVMYTNSLGRTCSRKEYVYRCDQCDATFTRTRKVYSKTQYCSIECVTKARSKDGALNRELEATNILRYGVARPTQNDDVRARLEATCVERYGETNVMKVTPFKQKSINGMRQTFNDRYGVDHPMKLKANVLKANFSRKETCLARYGVTSIVYVPQIALQIELTCLEKYGVRNPMQNIEIKAKAMETRRTNSKPFSSSKEELEVFRFLCEIFGEEDVTHTRWHFGWPIDFYVQSIDTFIQYDGAFYHTHDPELRTRFEWLEKNFQRDMLQNEIFAKAGKRLVRITYEDFYVIGRHDKSTVIDKIRRS